MKPNGLILCGGRSRRMGQDKWQLNIQGRSWLEHMIDMLGPFCERVYVSVVAPLNASFLTENDYVFDALPNEGPLGAWRSYVELFPDRPLLSMPVDMPKMQQTVLQSFRGGESGYLVGPTEKAYLAALLQPTIYSDLVSRFDEGQRSVHRFWSQIPHTTFQVEDDEPLKNLNSPQDLGNIDGNQL